MLDDGREAIVVDPGCFDTAEEHELGTWLDENGLKPVRLVLTHAHIDHVLGCAWMHKRYGLLPEMHRADLPLLHAAERQGQMYGVPCEAPRNRRSSCRREVKNNARRPVLGGAFRSWSRSRSYRALAC